MARNERNLARSFHDLFLDRFNRECESVRTELLPVWKDSAAWTKFMLGPEQGFLTRTATDWTRRNLNLRCEAKSEWAKFDLMLVDSTAGDEWWLSVPIVTIEHENNDTIHDEVWKVACWTSRLKVLITYHVHGEKAAQKRETAARIIRSIHPDGDSAEWLLLSAPRTWKGRLEWEAHEWSDEGWSVLGS